MVNWSTPVPRLRARLASADAAVWLDELVAVLRGVDTHHSLNRAAADAGIGYRRAWQIVEEAATLASARLTEPRRGGSSGGGSSLTTAGRELLTFVEGVLADLSGLLDAARPTGTASPKAATKKSTAGKALPDAPTALLASSVEPVESGLLDALEAAFERETGRRVFHLAVGSGSALALASGGRVDMALTHAPALEEELLTSGAIGSRTAALTSRYVLAYSTIATGLFPTAPSTLSEGLAWIADHEIPFVSRADRSGTHLKELDIWKRQHRTPSGSWYQPLAGAMGSHAAAQLAGRTGGCTLLDRLSAVGAEDDVRFWEVEDPLCENLFSLVLPASQTQGTSTARRFAEWLHGANATAIISAYGVAPARDSG